MKQETRADKKSQDESLGTVPLGRSHRVATEATRTYSGILKSGGNGIVRLQLAFRVKLGLT